MLKFWGEDKTSFYRAATVFPYAIGKDIKPLLETVPGSSSNAIAEYSEFSERAR